MIRILLTLLFSFAMLTSMAQQTDSTYMLFTDWVQQTESSSDFRFYYDVQSMDSLLIEPPRAGMPAALDELFEGTENFFYIDSLSNVYITRGRQLRASLPVNYFRKDSAAESSNYATLDYLYDDFQRRMLTEDQVIYEVGQRTNKITEPVAVITGSIRNADTGEPIAGAVIHNITTDASTATGPLGHFSLTVPTGRNSLETSFIGMTPVKRELMVYNSGTFDIELYEKVIALREVIIRSEADANVESTQMGVEKIDASVLKQVPVAFGEADIMKVVLTLPGVQSAGESSTGLNVRGGNVDQNLILFDNTVLYNPSHLFGFFSVFNPDIVQDMQLYKSGVPASYGGRLSSVMEVRSREGNKKKFAGSGGIGLVTSRLTLEGPLVKDKTSILIGGRSTYSDWLLNQIDDESLENSTASFYDVNLHINHEANEKNSFDLTAYYSKDRFRLNNDTLYRYSNAQAAMRWEHSFGTSLFGEFSASYSRYDFDISSDRNEVNAFQLDSKINQMQLQADFSYFKTENKEINFGASIIRYDITPGDLSPQGVESLITPVNIQKEKALESAVYASTTFKLNEKLLLDAGIRFSFYQYLGPQKFNEYAGDAPDKSSVTDTIEFTGNSVIANYQGPEYRLSARYLINSRTSLKLSAQRMRQYIHMISNTTAVAPTSFWKLSDQFIRPQVGDQLSMGYYMNFKRNTIEASVEVYYKRTKDFLDYKNGALLLLNEDIETDLLSTEGRAYGAEFLLRKKTGKLNGWLSYTYSRSQLRTVDDSYDINNGQWYSSNFDKPHDVTLVGNYRFSRRISMSLNFTYSTGRPITIPTGKYFYEGGERLAYSDRNSYRIPDYYRADFSINIEGNHKVRKLAHSSWSLSVYNLTGRDNVYSVYFKSENGTIQAYKLSIFTQPIPTITYNFKF